MHDKFQAVSLPSAGKGKSRFGDFMVPRCPERSGADRGCEKERQAELDGLTLHFDRTPLEASIQTYSAMTAPFWSSLENFSS